MGREQVKLHSKQAVPVSPELVRLLNGNVASAYFYRQLQFYANLQDGWFEKSSTDLERDLGISRYQQRRIRESLEKMGIIETQSIRGGTKPAIRFRILINYCRP